MGTVNNAIILEKGLNAVFQVAFANGEDPADVMGSILTTRSTSDREKMGWLGQVPNLVLFKDERQLRCTTGIPDRRYYYHYAADPNDRSY